MRRQSRSTRMWSATVASLCVLWFATPAGAIPLESWDDKIPSPTLRFKVLPEFDNAAVLDKETGLVWERTPSLDSRPWKYGKFECASRTIGNRKGWRLPSVHELASLLDPSPGVTPPLLPPGHPFTTGATGVQSAIYWSGTTIKGITSNAWGVNFSNGEVTDFGEVTTSGYLHWCVRGGQNHGDEY